MNVTEQVLLAKELVSEDQLGKWKVEAKRTNSTLENLVVENKVLNEQNLYKLIAEQLNAPVIAVPYGVDLDSDMASKFSPDDMERLHFIPIIAKSTTYIVSDIPESPERDPRIIKVLGTMPDIAVCTPSVFDKLVQKLVAPLEINKISSNLSDAGSETSNVQELKKTGNEIPDLLAMIIRSAIDMRASDIQFLPKASELSVYFKIDGKKHFFRSLPRNINDNIFRIIAKDAGMTEINITKPAVGKAEYSLGGSTVSLRVSMIKTYEGIDINMRILDNNITPLDNLGITPALLEKYKKFYQMSKGLILVTGPTGSGKSTTLYSGLADCGVEDRTVVSVEDPVEYVVNGASQVEVNEKAGNTFASSVKAFLRRAPDVIIVGEIRDKEVGQEAFRAAATGHLVFSTIHTNDAPSAITRLIDLGIPPYSIAESLAAVVAQRLVRRVCPHCAEDYTITEDDKLYLEHGFFVGDVVKKSKGCEICHGTGYYSRTAINEIVVLDMEIRDMLDSGRGPTAIRKYIRNDLHVPTLVDDAIYKVKAGITTMDEIAFMFDEIV